MFTLRKFVRPYEQFPKWYRQAYYDFCGHRAACYPIGLHLVVIAARWLRLLSFWCPPDRLEKAYFRGVDDGRKQNEHQTKMAWESIDTLMDDLAAERARLKLLREEFAKHDL